MAGTLGKTDHAHHLRECAAVSRLCHLCFDDNQEIRGKALAALVYVARIPDNKLYQSALREDHWGMEQTGKAAVRAKLNDPLPQVRAAAVVLANICEVPITAYLADRDPTVSGVTALVLAHEDYFRNDKRVAGFASSPYSHTRMMVAWLLGLRYSMEFLPNLESLAKDSDEGVRRSARDSIKRITGGPMGWLK